MTTFVSNEVQAGLDAARRAQKKRSSRYRVHVGEDVFKILTFSPNTFSVEAERAPQMRGLVDIFDGPRHLYQALIVTSREEAGEQVYEFKRNTIASNRAALDFAQDENAPIALLPSS